VLDFDEKMSEIWGRDGLFAESTQIFRKITGFRQRKKRNMTNNDIKYGNRETGFFYYRGHYGW